MRRLHGCDRGVLRYVGTWAMPGTLRAGRRRGRGCRRCGVDYWSRVLDRIGQRNRNILHRRLALHYGRSVRGDGNWLWRGLGNRHDWLRVALSGSGRGWVWLRSWRWRFADLVLDRGPLNWRRLLRGLAICALVRIRQVYPLDRRHRLFIRHVAIVVGLWILAGSRILQLGAIRRIYAIGFIGLRLFRLVLNRGLVLRSAVFIPWVIVLGAVSGGAIGRIFPIR